MVSMRRALDRYKGIKFCDMTPDQQHDFLAAYAERASFNGANLALSRVGLDKEESVTNLKELISAMNSYKKASIIVKTALWTQTKETFKTVVRVTTYVIGICIVAFCIKSLFSATEAARLIKLLPLE